MTGLPGLPCWGFTDSLLTRGLVGGGAVGDSPLLSMVAEGLVSPVPEVGCGAGWGERGWWPPAWALPPLLGRSTWL